MAHLTTTPNALPLPAQQEEKKRYAGFAKDRRRGPDRSVVRRIHDCGTPFA
jgi:hypothetical protein